MTHLPGMAAVALILGAATSCGAARGIPDIESAQFTEHDSCGNGFTVRDNDGTMRLTVRASTKAAKGSDPAVFDLEHDEWSGYVEVGTGLVVWPCHDIATDFDGEHVEDVWTVISGTIEVLDPIVASPDGGGSGPVRALLHTALVETSDGSTVSLHDIELLNPQWGFSGG
ncbi:MAG: hypothetical protein R2710_12985 [Acidimicrobiales bacterium]